MGVRAAAMTTASRLLMPVTTFCVVVRTRISQSWRGEFQLIMQSNDQVVNIH
jgi:hypothetical protein